MATTAQQLDGAQGRRLNPLRVTVATSLAAAAFLVLCWIGASMGFGPGTHMYVSLFSEAGVTSAVALFAGVCWSFFGGAIIGLIYALIYNSLAALER
jgi:hypothetical protein